MLVGDRYSVGADYGMFGLGQEGKSYLNFLIQRSDMPGMPPVKGATITVVGPDDQSQSVATDENGMYRFEFPYAENSEVRYKVEAPGFADAFGAASTFKDPQTGGETVILDPATSVGVPVGAIVSGLVIAGIIVGNVLLKKY